MTNQKHLFGKAENGQTIKNQVDKQLRSMT